MGLCNGLSLVFRCQAIILTYDEYLAIALNTVIFIYEKIIRKYRLQSTGHFVQVWICQ